MGDIYIPLLKDTKDLHYRYKMPKLTAKVEGSGNGIKTVITNMSAIAKALNRPPTYPTKYFGCELGAQVTMDNDIYVVNGSHDADKLLQLLYSFIKKFVLCPKCNNPETALKISNDKNKIINQNCVACGYRGTIATTTHKLTTYIINHPPNNDTATTAASAKKSSADGGKSKSKKEKSSKKHGKSNGNGTNGSASGDEFDNNNNSNGGGGGGGDGDGFDDDDFGSDDLTADAYEERMRSLTSGVSTIHVADQAERANLFYKMIKDRKESNQLDDVQVHKDLFNEASRLGVKEKALLILSEVLFTDSILEQIKQYDKLLLRFCYENPKAQKYLLGGFEKIVGDLYKDKLLVKVPNILKAFYDHDILDEEALFEWADKPSKKYVSKDVSKLIREKASAFIQWLKDAEVEEDSSNDEANKKPQAANGSAKATNGQQKNKANNHNHDEDDDDESDVEIEYSHRVSGIKVETIKPVNNDAAKDEADDLNIDDI